MIIDIVHRDQSSTIVQLIEFTDDIMLVTENVEDVNAVLQLIYWVLRCCINSIQSSYS